MIFVSGEEEEEFCRRVEAQIVRRILSPVPAFTQVNAPLFETEYVTANKIYRLDPPLSLLVVDSNASRTAP